MYRIALCDDEPDELHKTKTMLNAYKMPHPDYAFEVQAFSGVALTVC